MHAKRTLNANLERTHELTSTSGLKHFLSWKTHATRACCFLFPNSTLCRLCRSQRCRTYSAAFLTYIYDGRNISSARVRYAAYRTSVYRSRRYMRLSSYANLLLFCQPPAAVNKNINKLTSRTRARSKRDGDDVVWLQKTGKSPAVAFGVGRLIAFSLSQSHSLRRGCGLIDQKRTAIGDSCILQIDCWLSEIRDTQKWRMMSSRKGM